MDQSIIIPVSSLDHVTLEYGPRFEYAPAEGETRGRIGLPPDGIPPHFWGIYMRSSDGHAVHIDDVADEDIARAYGAISEELLTDSAMSLWEAVCTAEPASRLANHADPAPAISAGSPPIRAAMDMMTRSTGSSAPGSSSNAAAGTTTPSHSNPTGWIPVSPLAALAERDNAQRLHTLRGCISFLFFGPGW